MAKSSEYSIKIEVDGGQAAAKVFDNIGKSVEGLDKDFDDTGKSAKKLDKNLDNLGDEAKKTGKQIDGAGDDARKAEKGFNSLAVGITGLASGLGLVSSAASAASAPFAALNETITETSRLVNEAALYDVSSSFLNQMTDAAKTAGRELDDVLDVLRDVRERSGEALAELSKGNQVNTFVEAFGALDVDPEGIKKMASDSVALFDFFYDKIGESMETGNAQIQFRLQELSSAGYEKIGPLVASGLRRGIETAEEFRAEMRALGSDFTAFELEEISALGSNFNTLGVVFENLKKTILVSLSPAIQTITEDLLNLAKRAFGSDGVESFGAKFGEFLTAGYQKAKNFARDISALLEDGKLGEAVMSSATRLGEIIGKGIVSGMSSYLGENLKGNLTNLHDRFLDFVGADEGAMIRRDTGVSREVSPEQLARQRARTMSRIQGGEGALGAGGAYDMLGFGSAYNSAEGPRSQLSAFRAAVEQVSKTARDAASKLRNLTGEIKQVGEDSARTDRTSLMALEQRGELLEFQLSAQFRGYSDTAKANALELKQFEFQRAQAKDALMNTKELSAGRDIILKTDLKILETRLKTNDATDEEMAAFEDYAQSIKTSSSAMDEVLRQFDERTALQREQILKNQELNGQLQDTINLEKEAATWGANWTQTLTDGIGGATSSLGGLISSLGNLLGIDLSGIGGMFNSLFSGVGGGQGGQIANLVMGGIGSVTSLFGGKGPLSGVGAGVTDWIGGATDGIGDFAKNWGGALTSLAGLGMGIYGLATGGGSASQKAAGAVDIASSAPIVGKEIGQAAGMEFAKGAGVNVANYSAQYGMSSLVGGVLAAVLGGSGAELGSQVSMAGGLTSTLGAGAVAGFNALGGFGATGAAPILGQAGAILGPAGSVLGAVGGGIVVGGKIGDAIGKGNYGSEASDAGMIGGAVGGGIGAGVGIATGAGAAAASMMGAAAGGTMAGIIGGLAVTGIGLIAAAVLAVVFALVGDAIAHTPLLGRQVDDTLRSTVLDAKNFESLQGFKDETGVGFQNLMTTKKTGTGQGQINAGIGESAVRADLLTAGFSADEVAGIMGTGTGYGYLAGGIPFGGAGGLRSAEGEFGMRRSKDDRGAAMMYEANYIGSEQVRMIYANAVRTFKEQGKTNEEAIDAANGVVSQHLAELGYDISGALLAFDDQLFIAQQSFAGATGAGVNESGRNEADLARRMQFASDGTMAQGMIDAANSWDTLFADSIPQGLTGLDLFLVGMEGAAFQSEEIALNLAQAAIETDKAFSSERAQLFAKSWGESAAIVGATLPGILMGEDVQAGLMDLVDQTAANIGGQLREAMAVSFTDAISSLMDERGGIAGGLASLTSLMNADLTTEDGRQLVLAGLPQAIADAKENLSNYIPVLKEMANAQAEVNDQIDVALGLMTEEQALVNSATRKVGENATSNFLIDLQTGNSSLRGGYKKMVEEFGKETADTYYAAVRENGKEAVDEWLQTIADAMAESEKLKSIGDLIGNSVGDGIATALRQYALTGDMGALAESLEDGISQAVFNGFLSAALESGPITALIQQVAERQSAAYQLFTTMGMDPVQIAEELKKGAIIQINEGMAGVQAQLGYLPELARALGLDLGSSSPTSPSRPTAPAGPAARNDLSFEQVRYDAGAGFIGSLGSYADLSIEKQNPMLNGRAMTVASSAQQTRDAQLSTMQSSQSLLRDMLGLLRQGEITREEFNEIMRERSESPQQITIELDGDELASVRAPGSGNLRPQLGR